MRRWLPAIVLLVLAGGCQQLKRSIVEWATPEYSAPDTTPVHRPGVELEPVAAGLTEPTDIQFVPDHPDWMVVTGKRGELWLLDLGNGQRRVLATFDVLTASEEGLLGIAFAPDYATSRRAFVNLVRRGPERRHESAVVELRIETDTNGQPLSAAIVRDIYVIEQPYPNHNAGQLAFGPDGMLYVGWGDGGWRDDPHEHGQNPLTPLGAMLRLDVSRSTDAEPWRVPPDNPFADRAGRIGVLPELWAYGLRNPWRYSFAPDGRMIVADVGQDTWEEVDIVAAGDNLGWNRREGAHCFPPDSECDTEGLVDPIWEYGRDLGASITGGYIWPASEPAWLAGRYVCGDFVSGRIWALRLPQASGGVVTDVVELGRWPMLISTFGRSAEALYVADYGAGVIRRLTAREGSQNRGHP
ncbi:MAG: dehydrogenase [Candidatus Dadabacteria bacterium]|nr:MAG: dehydrogenase [Candidatus Dadabacteria bacterium]